MIAINIAGPKRRVDVLLVCLFEFFILGSWFVFPSFEVPQNRLHFQQRNHQHAGLVAEAGHGPLDYCSSYFHSFIDSSALWSFKLFVSHTLTRGADAQVLRNHAFVTGKTVAAQFEAPLPIRRRGPGHQSASAIAGRDCVPYTCRPPGAGRGDVAHTAGGCSTTPARSAPRARRRARQTFVGGLIARQRRRHPSAQ